MGCLIVELVMPIFEYKCINCGKVTELLERTGAEEVKLCTHCGGKKLKRIFSTFALGIKEGSSKRCLACTDQTCPHSDY